MSLYDLDTDRRVRPARRVTGIPLTAALLVGSTFALTFAGSPEAAPPSYSAAISPSPTFSAAPVPPSSETTSSIGGPSMFVRSVAATVSKEASAITLRERYVLIGLLMLCFAVLCIGGHALWRRSFKDIDQRS